MLIKSILSLIILLTCTQASASLQWSGTYRFEGLLIDNPSLVKDVGDSKDYALQHLVLKPKMVVADRFELNARFDAFNGATDQNVHPSNQVGSAFGSSSNNNDQYYTSAAGNAGADIIEITQAYLTYTHNFGALIVGRAPVHFGLGMSFDAGNGLFDHWYDTRDLVGVKVHFGDVYIFPMYAKITEGSIGEGSSEGQDLRLQAEYENSAIDTKLGFLFTEKKIKAAAVDFSDQFGDFPSPYTRDEGSKIRSLSFYYKKALEKINYGIEFSYLSGNTGLDFNDEDVEIQSFGVATEFEYTMPEHSLTFALKAGYASGDDKSTPDKVESFIFNRNYDVGMLLFNHGLGQQDLLGVQSFLKREYNVNNPATPNSDRIEDFDVEAISNVLYLAPSVQYDINDILSVKSTFITGFLIEDAQNFIDDMDSVIGYELDLSVTYKPIERVQFTAEGAALLPGSAFKAGGIDSKFTYGLMGRAAVNF